MNRKVKCEDCGKEMDHKGKPHSYQECGACLAKEEEELNVVCAQCGFLIVEGKPEGRVVEFWCDDCINDENYNEEQSE